MFVVDCLAQLQTADDGVIREGTRVDLAYILFGIHFMRIFPWKVWQFYLYGSFTFTIMSPRNVY